MAKEGKKLRSGYTTGACAAAAAKAAATALFSGTCPGQIKIPFPDGSRVSFIVTRCEIRHEEAEAAVIKDAGDDPDVTNGAEVAAVVGSMCGCGSEPIEIRAGKGVGKVTIETHNATFDTTYCSEHRGFIPGDYVMLAVSDNGCGIENDILENIFEPFFTTKGVGVGTGQGLAIARSVVVDKHSGSLELESEIGRGSTFIIRLPLKSH